MVSENMATVDAISRLTGQMLVTKILPNIYVDIDTARV